jgi:predicted transcriptional regulator
MQKQRVQQVLDAFPEDVNVDEFLEKVYLLQKIEAGERQIEAGETVSHEDAKKRLKKWLA